MGVKGIPDVNAGHSLNETDIPKALTGTTSTMKLTVLSKAQIRKLAFM